MKAFPPYELLKRAGLSVAPEKIQKLENLYYKTQESAWDGKEVLRAALAKHGGIRVRGDVKESLAKVLSIILWGEFAAWSVSADLAEAISDVEPKMAATGQAFDEARHFYVMRDYLLEMGIPVPPLDGFTRIILTRLIECDDLVKKLVGMQLLVENVALNLFRMVRKTGVEPVLAELLPYFERDEARHVGLGVLYLPTLLEQLSPMEEISLLRFQFEINVHIAWAVQLLRDDFLEVGVDFWEAVKDGLRTQGEAFTRMVASGGGDKKRAARGIYVPRIVRKLNHIVVDATFPPMDRELPWWHRKILRAGQRLAGKVNTALLARLALRDARSVFRRVVA